MIASNLAPITLVHDAELVARSIAGERAAFAEIVSRYQSLVCSIAYSASGSLSHSEDLAQETFLAAWRQMSELREPERLRPWLCGIARNLVLNALRRHGREPANDAQQIDVVSEAPSAEAAPAERAIRAEEEAILWDSLARIPHTYREPLVLFYREHQSIEQVARALDMSEDTARQRLSRGRKLLHEQVLAFVEGTLERSSPGKAFTLAVVASLPAYGMSATAAAVSLHATKGSALAKSAGFVAVFTALLGPLIAIAGTYLGIRASLEAARTPRERSYVVEQARIGVIGSVLYVAALFALAFNGPFWAAHPWAFAIVGISLPLSFAVWMLRISLHSVDEARRVRAEERLRDPQAFEAAGAKANGSSHSYRSKASFLGLPLIDIRYGPSDVDAKPALGWIAVGDRAIGVLFAIGQIAVGGISVGSVAAGVVAIGGVSVGLVSMGGVTIGVVAMGGAAIAVYAMGCYAVGWICSIGALAVSHQYAVGGFAIAEHANDAVANAYIATSLPFGGIPTMLAALVVLTVVPSGILIWHLRRQRSSPK